MPSRNVILTDHYDNFIEASIADGHFSDASEAVRAGLHLLELQAAQQKLAWLSGAVQEGVDAIERGEFVELNSDDDIDRYVSGIHAEVVAQHGRNAKRAHAASGRLR